MQEYEEIQYSEWRECDGPPIMDVGWDDSTSTKATWLDAEALERKLNRENAITCFSSGYYVGETSRVIILARSYALNADGDIELWGGVEFIPQGCIKNTSIRKR